MPEKYITQAVLISSLILFLPSTEFMRRLQRSTASHQIFIYSFKILIWENPITILPGRKHQTDAEMCCKCVEVAVHSTPPTSAWVWVPHFSEASHGETFKCFLVLQGKGICADGWKLGAFCKDFCLEGIQNRTKTSRFSLFRFWVLIWNGLQGEKLCWAYWISAL